LGKGNLVHWFTSQIRPLMRFLEERFFEQIAFIKKEDVWTVWSELPFPESYVAELDQ